MSKSIAEAKKLTASDLSIRAGIFEIEVKKMVPFGLLSLPALSSKPSRNKGRFKDCEKLTFILLKNFFWIKSYPPIQFHF